MDLLNKLKSMLGEETTLENVTEETSNSSCDCADGACTHQDNADCKCSDGSCGNCEQKETNE